MVLENFLFDSHAHLLDKRFSNDIDKVIQGVGGIMCMYTPGENYELFKKLLSKGFIWGSAGIHPHDAKNAWKMWKGLTRVLELDKVMAVGEVGLDYYYNNSPCDVQKEVFKKQLKLAEDIKLPVVIHTRDAFGETFEILKSCKVKKILIHCFSGNVQQMKELIGMGCYISLGGIMTFKKSDELKEVAREMPLKRLLIETDCPYLAPEPYRGKRNQPSYVKYIAEEIARIKDLNAEEVAKITYSNTLKFFNICN